MSRILWRLEKLLKKFGSGNVGLRFGNKFSFLKIIALLNIMRYVSFDKMGKSNMLYTISDLLSREMLRHVQCFS